MKKILITLTLLCVALTLHALDCRQVIFGNAYENIIEINADDFFEQYPDVKEHYRAVHRGHDYKGDPSYLPNYYRVYEQVIGNKTFFRVLMSFDAYTDIDFLNSVGNVYESSANYVFFTQYVFYKESESKLIRLGDKYLYGGKMVHQYGVDTSYYALNIIERDNDVIGLMNESVYIKYGSPDTPSANENYAEYCQWEKAINSAREETDTISYIQWENRRDLEDKPNVYTVLGINIVVHTNVLVDSKRPFMYTLQNAFDGDPTTSYVEDSDDDLFRLLINLNRKFELGQTLDISAFSLINGYASGDYYKQNNQIKSIEVTAYYGNRKDVLHYQLQDTLKLQRNTMTKKGYDGFGIGVEEITPGTKYNDTALAELDIYIDGEGWLFGGLE